MLVKDLGRQAETIRGLGGTVTAERVKCDRDYEGEFYYIQKPLIKN